MFNSVFSSDNLRRDVTFYVSVKPNGHNPGIINEFEFVLPIRDISYERLHRCIFQRLGIQPAMIIHIEARRKTPLHNSKICMDKLKQYIETRRSGHIYLGVHLPSLEQETTRNTVKISAAKNLKSRTAKVMTFNNKETESYPFLKKSMRGSINTATSSGHETEPYQINPKPEKLMHKLFLDEETDLNPVAKQSPMKTLYLNDLTQLFTREANSRCVTELNTYADIVLEKNISGVKSSEEPQEKEGVLVAMRRNSTDLAELLRSGNTVAILTESNDVVFLNFVQNVFPPLKNGLRLAWQKDEESFFNCNEAYIPVRVGKKINYSFDKDAEFVENFTIRIDDLMDKVKTNLDSVEKESIKKKENDKPEKSNPSQKFYETTKTGSTEQMSDSLKEYLESFKSGLLNDVQTTVNTIKTPPAPQTEPNTKNKNRSSFEEERQKVLECFKKMQIGYNENEASSSKHRSTENAKKAIPSKKREYRKLVEVSSNLLVFSKCGFKVRMPRNSTKTLRFHFIKYGKYRIYKEEPTLEVRSASDAIECCVKPVLGTEYKIPVDKNTYSFYDVRVKTKDKSGKFRLYFNVVHNNKNCGRSFKLEIRVRKGYVVDALTNDIYPSSGNQTPPKIPNTVKSLALDSIFHAELAAEGFNAAQDDLFYSPSSDSEDSEVEASKPKMSKDEEINTRFSSGYKDKKYAMLKNDSDDDSYSSISFLADEDEARDNAEIVQMPSLFFPNQSKGFESDFVPVRIKYKKNEKNTKKNDSSSCSISDEAGANMDEMFVSSVSQTAQNADSENTNFFEENSRHAYNRSVYPNLQGLKEVVKRDVNTNVPDKSAKSKTLENIQESINYFMMNDQNVTTPSSSNQNVAGSSQKNEGPSTPINILPEKVFETAGDVFKSVFSTFQAPKEQCMGNIRQCAENTISCSQDVINTISQEFNNIASVIAESSKLMSPIPAPSSTNVSVDNEVSSGSACSNASNGAESNAINGADVSDAGGQSPLQTEKEAPQRSFTLPRFADNRHNNMYDRSTTPPPSVNEDSNVFHRCLIESIIRQNYAGYPAPLLKNLLILNEMGFYNHEYNATLLKQYSNDLNKTIENLLRY